MSQVGELKVRIIGDDKDLQKTLDSSASKLDKWGKAAKRAILAVGIGKTFVALTKNVINATAAYENMRVALGMATSSIEAQNRALKFVTSESQRLGKSIVTVGESYKQLAAAAKGTSLEGEQAEKIFRAVGNASIVMGLSAEQTRGTFRALEQMISKGNIQAEELRGQLGERLPGSFQITARAMGVTTQELNKMLDRGEVFADEVLPKLATELEKTFGPSVPKAVKNISFAISDLQGAFDDLFIVTEDNESIDDLKTSLNDLAKLLRDQQTKEAFTSLASALVDITSAAAKGATYFTQIGKGIGIIAGQIAVGDNSAVGQLEENQKKLNDLYYQRQQLIDNFYTKISQTASEGMPASTEGVEMIDQKINALLSKFPQLKNFNQAIQDINNEIDLPAAKGAESPKSERAEVERVIDKNKLLKRLKEEYIEQEIDQEAMLIEQVRQMRDEQTMYDKEKLDQQLQNRKEYANAMIKAEIDKANLIKQNEETFWGDINTAATSGSEKMQKVMQKIAIARAVMTGYEAAVNAWNAGMLAGAGTPYAPAIAAAYTAASLAKTGALISSMKNGGSSQSAAGGGGSTATPAATAPAQQEPSRLVNIAFNGGDYERNLAGNIISVLNDEIKRGGIIEGVQMS